MRHDISTRLSEIPALTVCGLAWTVILSLSAGNVRATQGEKEDDNVAVVDGVTIEKRMAIAFSAREKAASKAREDGGEGELITTASSNSAPRTLSQKNLSRNLSRNLRWDTV